MSDDALHDELTALYAELDAEVATMGGRCDRSGRCCRFREFGHRLYVTEPERLHLIREAGGPPAEVPDDRCPFLAVAADGLPTCGNRSGRAIGCRIFFCNVASAEPFHAVYEKYHSRMKEIGERHGLPYRYGELLASLEPR